MNILVLVGSLRAGSLNAQFAAEAVQHLADSATVTVYDGLADLPFYSEELDVEQPPAGVVRLRKAVAAADALIVVTPEYNGSLSSVLKNAIDWVSRPRQAAAIAGKSVAVLSASMSPRGGASAREHALRILTVAGAKPLTDTVGIASAHAAFADGRLTDDAVRAELAGVLAQLLDTRLTAA